MFFKLKNNIHISNGISLMMDTMTYCFINIYQNSQFFIRKLMAANRMIKKCQMLLNVSLKSLGTYFVMSTVPRAKK